MSCLPGQAGGPVNVPEAFGERESVPPEGGGVSRNLAHLVLPAEILP